MTESSQRFVYRFAGSIKFGLSIPRRVIKRRILSATREVAPGTNVGGI